MSPHAPEKPKDIARYAAVSGNEPADSDLDRSGQAIVSLLQQAAEAARANEDRATGIARKLSGQVQAVEDRCAQLESDVTHFQDRALRAEKWLLRIYKEIEDQFFNQKAITKSGQSAHR